MILPENIFLIAVPEIWYRSVVTQYIAAGSGSVNCWGIRHKDVAQGAEPEPGALVLFLQRRNDISFICGGGFYQPSLLQTPTEAWNEFGVYNGAESLDEFKSDLVSRGLKRGSKIKSNVVSGIFVFARRDCYEVPSELDLPDIKECELVSLGLDTPQGLFLERHLMHMRQGQLRDDSADPEWSGIFRMAEQKNARDYSAFFKAKMLKAYDFKCAVTHETLKPVLKVAHIKAFYDERFLKPGNGLVLRADIESLFSKGYITAVYTDEDKAVIKVSKVLKDSEYMKFNGCALYLPEDPALRPNPEYLKWHAQHRFENWLTFGTVKPLKA